MAMKKKFLGLALAAAVALPATTAYAANDTQSSGCQLYIDDFSALLKFL